LFVDVHDKVPVREVPLLMNGNTRIGSVFKPSVPPCSHCGRPAKITGVYYEGRKYMEYYVCQPCFDDPAKMETLRSKIETRFARQR